MARKRVNQKRPVMIDSEADEDDMNNELDVESGQSKENKNIANIMKNKMGATVVKNDK